MKGSMPSYFCRTGRGGIRHTLLFTEDERKKTMRDKETLKFERVGASYILLVLAIGIILPLTASLIICIVMGGVRVDALLAMALVFGFMIWIILLMSIAWGNFSRLFIKKTAKEVDKLPYRFDSSFQGRGGNLYIDMTNGMIGFISAYNPFKLQIFNASRIERIETIASAMTGIRFIFYLDGKKISMPTLLTNRVVSTKSGIGAEAVSKADAFVEILKAAKARAEGRM